MKTIIIWIFLCFCFTGILHGQTQKNRNKAANNDVSAETLEQQINRIARNYGIDGRLFHSLIYAESSFKTNAMSYKGAGCLTQLMPATARRFGLRVDAQVDERFSNTEKCLAAGAKYLAFLLATFKGDVRLALAGYNAGEGAVMKYGNRVPPYRETVQYVEKICALYFGQTGHGVTAAYNQVQAQEFVNSLYAVWKPRVKLTASVQPVGSLPNSAIQGVLQLDENQGETVADLQSIDNNKKRVIKRVSIEETAPRIRTESLSFW